MHSARFPRHSVAVAATNCRSGLHEWVVTPISIMAELVCVGLCGLTDVQFGTDFKNPASRGSVRLADLIRTAPAAPNCLSLT